MDEELDAYVIESFHIDIPMLKQAFGSQHTIIVVGYPNVDEAEKFATIKALDKRERSIALPDEERKDDIRRFTHLSKKFQQIAKEQAINHL